MDASTASSLPPAAQSAIAPAPALPSHPRETSVAARAATSAGADGRYRVMIDIDEGSKRVIATFVDPDTNEVIDQLPSKMMLRIAAAIREMLGSLVDTEA